MMILMLIGVFAVILLVCIVLLLQPPLALPHAPPETVPQASATLPAAEPHADLALAPPADQVRTRSYRRCQAGRLPTRLW